MRRVAITGLGVVAPNGIGKEGFWQANIEGKSGIDKEAIESSLRTKIKLYKRRAREIEDYLSKKPEEWGKFQSEFNAEVNSVFREIMNFEKVNIDIGCDDKVHKLKRLFINRIRDIFMKGVYIEWSLRKPFGYAGDFKIIDDIYMNNPTTTGFDRLFDNYYQMSAICVAVRNRKEDFKRLIVEFVNNSQKNPLRIMNLASGSCREIKELIFSNLLSRKDIIFDCYDNDEKAIEFAKTLIPNSPNINFIRENALRIYKINKRYDFIYVTGLFDYFNNNICIRLIKNLKKLLNTNGILVISNVRDKYSNPSVHFMEWVGDWNLFYRTDSTFRKIFIDAGFREDELRTLYEQQGIMQYIIASNKKA